MLHPETFLHRAMSSFRGFNIDELLATVYRQAETMRAYSEIIRENILTDTYDMTKDTNTVAQGTLEGIAELHRKADEVLLGQKSLQRNFELVSGKNHLFQFLMEFQSKHVKRQWRHSHKRLHRHLTLARDQATPGSSASIRSPDGSRR